MSGAGERPAGFGGAAGAVPVPYGPVGAVAARTPFRSPGRVPGVPTSRGERQ